VPGGYGRGLMALAVAISLEQLQPFSSQRITIYVNAVEQHDELVVEKRPDAVCAPRRLVTLYDSRACLQRTEIVELTPPVTNQLIEKWIGLRFAKLDLLKETSSYSIRFCRTTMTPIGRSTEIFPASASALSPLTFMPD